MAEKTPAEIAADRRRQAYWRRRRTLENMKSRPAPVAVDRMATRALWELVIRNLLTLEDMADRNASPDLLGLAMETTAAVLEIRMRGVQLTLDQQ